MNEPKGDDVASSANSDSTSYYIPPEMSDGREFIVPDTDLSSQISGEGAENDFPMPVYDPFMMIWKGDSTRRYDNGSKLRIDVQN